MQKGGVNEMTSSYEPDYDDYDDYNADEEAWYALTDGQYGDYPGCEVDYDFMGW